MSEFIKDFWDCEGRYYRGKHGGQIVNYSIDASKDVIIIAGEMGDIALINNTYTEDEQLAYAHLITAAPDMYDALKAISQEKWLMAKMDARCECLITEAVAKVEKEPK